MTALVLTTAERRARRADAHHLQPVVMVGNDGLTPAVEREVAQALDAHGLVKVRVFADDRAVRAAFLERLADALGAAPVQHIGKLLVLWRPPADKAPAPREDTRPGPRTVKLVKFSKSGNHRPTVKKIKVFGNERLTVGGIVKRARARPGSAKKRAAD